MADPTPATYNLRDDAGYLVYATDDLEQAVGEYDERRQTGSFHFDDFGITELRERLTVLRRKDREGPTDPNEADDG